MWQKGHFRVKKHWIGLIIIEVIFLVLGILSGKVRTVLGNTTLIWRSLGTPPGKAIRVVDADYLAVRVQTVQGQIYFCRLYSQKECWIPKDQSSYIPYSTIPISDASLEFSIFRKPPPLPGGAVDKLNITNWPSEYKQVLTIYVITEEGKVYVWQDGRLDAFDPLIYNFQGILVALLCGFVLWWFVEWRTTAFQRRMRDALKGK